MLAQFDCKTDVDDLHTVAAFATLMAHPDFAHVKYHAVAGTYGIQEGLYVPPNSLFRMAFGDNWTDAHENLEAAVEKVKAIAIKTLNSGGAIWIAEAGQSDFSADLVKAVRAALPELDTSQRIHVVQHSDWNEEVTAPESLAYVKQHCAYHKIPDGNAVDNGTPGFRTPGYKDWNAKVTNADLKAIWQHAVALGMQYNGKDGRYNNEAIAEGGLDFSDLSETCWILGLRDIRDTAQFFNAYSR